MARGRAQGLVDRASLPGRQLRIEIPRFTVCVRRARAHQGVEGFALFQRYAVPPPLVPMPTRLRERLQAAEAAVRDRPGDVAAWTALADLLHFEVYWLQATEAVYERILQLDPRNDAIRWRLLDVTEMTSDVERENVLWCELLRASRGDGWIKQRYGWFRKSFYVDDPKTERCRDEQGKVIALD